jgi:hypothetical protein
MRNLCISEILRLIQLQPINYNLRPWDQWSNQDLLEFYGNLRINIETEDYDEE